MDRLAIILLALAMGWITAPLVTNALDRVDSAEHWEIQKHELIITGIYTREELEEDDEDESYWVQHREQFERWTAHANDFLRDVRLGK